MFVNNVVLFDFLSFTLQLNQFEIIIFLTKIGLNKKWNGFDAIFLAFGAFGVLAICDLLTVRHLVHQHTEGNMFFCSIFDTVNVMHTKANALKCNEFGLYIYIFKRVVENRRTHPPHIFVRPAKNVKWRGNVHHRWSYMFSTRSIDLCIRANHREVSLYCGKFPFYSTWHLSLSRLSPFHRNLSKEYTFTSAHKSIQRSNAPTNLFITRTWTWSVVFCFYFYKLRVFQLLRFGKKNVYSFRYNSFSFPENDVRYVISIFWLDNLFRNDKLNTQFQSSCLCIEYVNCFGVEKKVEIVCIRD